MGLFGTEKRPPESSSQQPQPAAPRPQPSASPGAASGRSIVSNACRVEGAVRSSDDLTIEGEVKGTIETSGLLTIAASGRLKADLHGRNVSVAGQVTGNITADERIELEPTAKVHGNITAPRILIKDGATFEGQVYMKSPTKGSGPSGGGSPEPTKDDAQKNDQKDGKHNKGK